MAGSRPIKPPAPGTFVAPVVILPENGEFTESSLNQLNGILGRILNKINGNISLGSAVQAERAGNLAAQYISFVTPATPGDEILQPHDLGHKPTGFEIVYKNAACDLYDSTVTAWTDTMVAFKATVGSVTLIVRLF